MHHVVGALVALGVAVLPVAAEAASCAGGLGDAQRFNVFVRGDVTGPPSVGGPLASGGTVHLDGFSVGAQDPGGTVLVGDVLELANGQVLGDAWYRTSASVPASVQVAGSLGSPPPVDLASTFVAVGAASATWAATPAHGVTTVLPWGVAFLVGVDPGLNVFEVDGAALAGLRYLRLDVPAGARAVINVRGPELAVSGAGIDLGTATPSEVLFNLPEARRLSLRGVGWRGSVLAPGASATLRHGSLEGGLFAAELEATASFRHAPFLDCPDDVPQPVCGDGLVNQPDETCDGEFWCRPDCTYCGDGIIQDPPEACDGDPTCTVTCEPCERVPTEDGLGIAGLYNVFSLDDVAGPRSIGGKVAAARSVTLRAFSVGAEDPGGDAVVTSDATLTYGTVHGNVAFSGSLTERGVGYADGGAPVFATPVDFDAAASHLRTLSASYAGLPATGTTRTSWWGGVWLEGSDPDMEVFTLQASDLDRARSVRLAVAPTARVIVNVVGGDVDAGRFGLDLGGLPTGELLWNFPTQRSVELTSLTFRGAVLAPEARVQVRHGVVEGTVVAGSVGGSGSYRWVPFGDGGSTCAEPEPGPGRAAGAELASEIFTARAVRDRQDPPVAVNANLLALAPGSTRHPVVDDLLEDRPAPVGLSLARVPGTGRVPWSSALGGELSLGYVQTGYNSNWPFPEGRQDCVPPDLMIDCCSYTLTEGEDGSGVTQKYYDPLDLYASEADADKALREVYAQIPIYLPFTDDNVSLWHGWIYNDVDRDPHGSLDFGTDIDEGDDPSMRVRSVAPGVVVAKYWDAWHGNVVVIEHPGINDFRYRSFYFHLRNGQANDIAMAKSRTTPKGDPKNSRDKYLLFADMAPDDRWWGKDEHAILVDVDDPVGVLEQIGWSGATGPGGQGAGLDTSGNITDPVNGNNHLHFMMAVQHPTWTGGEWLYVDPYGVYDQQESGCYDLVDNTRYDRLFAPFYPYFHGVDLGVVNFYLYYYGQMGRSPTTFTVQRTSSGTVQAAGTFKTGFAPGWYLYDYMPYGDFVDQWQILTGAPDFKLTERSVTLDGSGVPRHNGTFRPDTIDDWSSFGRLTIPDYVDTFEDLVDDGYDLVEFFGYREGSTDRIAALFDPGDGQFLHHGLLGSQAFEDLTNDLADDGWLPVDVNVMEMAGGTYLSAIYRQTGDTRMVHWGMSEPEYQAWVNFYLANGWDLEVVQNYAKGKKYAAIFAK
ncbi:MAG: choice-of-anchor A family protein [Alphaproteobacteria bacterium]|nr:choice-of-anchor A family protein [Alphaproteobacteria bacterium]